STYLLYQMNPIMSSLSGTLLTCRAGCNLIRGKGGPMKKHLIVAIALILVFPVSLESGGGTKQGGKLEQLLTCGILLAAKDLAYRDCCRAPAPGAADSRAVLPTLVSRNCLRYVDEVCKAAQEPTRRPASPGQQAEGPEQSSISQHVRKE